MREALSLLFETVGSLTIESQNCSIDDDDGDELVEVDRLRHVRVHVVRVRVEDVPLGR